MKFGVAVPSRGPMAEPALLRESIVLAERSGYDSLWFADHVVIPKEEAVSRTARWYDPFVSASFACALTSRVKLCFGVVVLPYRSPLVVAKAIASLDQLSGGRVLVGVGPGYMRGEFEALGAGFTDRGRRTDEYIKVMKAVWSSPVASFTGAFVRFSDVILDPRPVQQPHPPIWVGGVTNAAIRRAVAVGDGWHPTFTSGIPHTEIKERVDQLKKEIAQQDRTRPLTLSIQAAWVSIKGVPAGMKPEYRNGQRVPMTGTPEEILEDLRFYRSLGVENVVVDFRNAPTPAGHLEALEYFARHIVPRV